MNIIFYCQDCVVVFNFVEDEDDYDDYDSEEPTRGDTRLMPPPSWIPGQPTPIQTSISSHRPGGTDVSPTTEDMHTVEEKHKLNTPLAAMLPPELADKDVRELFPEFRPGSVCSVPQIAQQVHLSHLQL